MRTSCSTANPEFDALLAKGNAAATNAEAIGFNQAEDVVLEDMPIIPLFFAVTQSVHSADVTDVVVDVFGRVDTSAPPSRLTSPASPGRRTNTAAPPRHEVGAARLEAAERRHTSARCAAVRVLQRLSGTDRSGGIPVLGPLIEAVISASASSRPTHSAPSTDLPGSRSL